MNKRIGANGRIRLSADRDPVNTSSRKRPVKLGRFLLLGLLIICSIVAAVRVVPNLLSPLKSFPRLGHFRLHIPNVPAGSLTMKKSTPIKSIVVEGCVVTDSLEVIRATGLDSLSVCGGDWPVMHGLKMPRYR